MNGKDARRFLTPKELNVKTVIEMKQTGLPHSLDELQPRAQRSGRGMQCGRRGEQRHKTCFLILPVLKFFLD